LIGSRFQRLLVVSALRRAEAAHHEHEFTPIVEAKSPSVCDINVTPLVSPRR